MEPDSRWAEDIVRSALLCLVVSLLFVGVSEAGSLSAGEKAQWDARLANCDPSTGLPPGYPRAQPNPTVDGRRPSVIVNPDWFKRPTPDDLGRAYPRGAWKARVSGRVVVRCLVGPDGQAHDCAVISETPSGMGFGEAAVKVMESATFIPQVKDCVPQDNAVVQIPLMFGR
jgi:TonB family protein